MDNNELLQLDRMVQQMRGVAEVMAASARAHARVEGMKAENTQRELRGEALAYPDQQFFDVIDEEGIGVNSVVWMMNS